MRRSPVPLSCAAAVGVVVGVALASALVENDIDVAEIAPALRPVLQAALALAWWIPGAALAWRRPALPFWWLALLAALAHAGASLFGAFAVGSGWGLWVASWLILIELPIWGAVVQLFPTGRPMPRWRRYLMSTVAAGCVGVGAAAIESLPVTVSDPARSVAGTVAVVMLAFSAIGCVVPLGVRIRQTVGPERAASRWILILVAITFFIPPLVAGGGDTGEVVAQVFTAAQLVLVAIAVLRYRVWGLAPMLQRSLRQAIVATDVERRRVRAELHDGIGGALTATRMKVDAARRLIDDRPERAGEMLESVSGDIGALVEDTRRLIEGLRPAVLDRVGLAPALRTLAGDLSRSDPGLAIEVHAEDVPPAAPAIETAIYQLVSEALHNVVRHAGATRCEVRFDVTDDEFGVTVVDNGRSEGGRVEEHTGIGMSTMAARAGAVGGYVAAGPQANGGFRVRAVVPRIDL